MYGGSYIADDSLIFSEAQAITGDAISTNVWQDMRTMVASDKPGAGGFGIPVGQAAAMPRTLSRNLIPISMRVVEAFNTLTSLTITLESDSQADLAGSPVVHEQHTVLLAGLTLGVKLPFYYMPEGVYGRFIGFRYNVNGTDPTTGEITTIIGLHDDFNPIAQA